MNNETMNNLLSRSVFYPLLIIFALAVFLRLLPGERIVDDAYITYRYARNLVNGAGFVYNPGERVMGTTTPLYTLLMAGLSLLLQTQNFPALSIWVNALADGVTCVLLVFLGEMLSGQKRVGLAAGLLYAVAAFSVTFAVGGMETSVCVMLLTFTAVLYLRRYPAWGLAAAFALLTRPDALIFLGPLGLDYGLCILAGLRNTKYGVLNSQFSIHKTVILFLAPLIPWLIFATLYFGTPVPHSIAAKSVTYQLNREEAFVRLWQHYSTPFFENVFIEKGPLDKIEIPFGGNAIALSKFWPLPGMVLFLSLYLIGWLSFIKRDSRAIDVGIYPLAYFATFAIANPLIFRWYLTPPLPLYFIGILGGVSHIVDSVSRIVKAKRLSFVVSRFTFPVASALFLLSSLGAWVLTPDHGPNRPAPDMAWFKLEQLYAQVGGELAPRITPQTVIAVGDIGAMGYFSGARILDTIGLVSPESVPYYPLPREQLVINYAMSADLIADRKPDYVVMLEVYGRRTLLTDPRFRVEYVLQQKIPTDIYGSDGMLVFKRQ